MQHKNIDISGRNLYILVITIFLNIKMEIVEIARELFENSDIRILGTNDTPLFVANDVGKILGITKIAASIKDYDEDEKAVNIVATPGGNQRMVLLTEGGLYKILYTSRKPIAKKFRNWVTHVLSEIRTKGRYDLSNEIETIKQRELEKDALILDLQSKIIDTPPVNYHKIDINEYIGKSIVYLVHIVNYDYKFGVTGDVKTRLNTHRNDFKKLGYDINIVKIWKCGSANIMSEVEGMIKILAKQNEMLVEKYNKTEIITTGDIEPIVSKIDEYVSDKNILDSRYFEIKKMELELKLQVEKNEARKLDIEDKRLEIELIKLRGEAHNQLNGKLNSTQLNDQLNEQLNEHLNSTQLIPIGDQPVVKYDIKEWIKNNPPTQQLLSNYYNDYKISTKSSFSQAKFNNEMISLGYAKKSHGKGKIWCR